MFAGGGDEHDSYLMDEIFTGWLGKGRLLYLPTALIYPAAMASGCRWMQSTMAAFGITAIEAWIDLAGKAAPDLYQYDAVYIGGGNTFYLLKELRTYGLDRALVEFARQGKPIYGGSAGAIILGSDITSCEHIDHNIVGLKDYHGLDLALGHTIWCHYTPQDSERIESYVRRSGIPSIGLTEKTGAYRSGSHLYAVGAEPAAYFTSQGCTFIASGEQII
ncbi:MAG: Type 1 glutamine amidotransferase-like domain-containing protein [Omnitrophica WOR_2 bacterium]